MRVSDVVSEFVGLSYHYSKESTLKEEDIDLGNYILLRMTKSSWCIYFLTSGSSLDIPASYIKFFLDLEVYHRGNIFNSRGIVDNGFEKFIYHMLLFVHLIQSKEYSNAISHLDEATKCGTKEFREYLKSRIGIDFEEIYFSSLNNNVFL